MTVTRYRTSDGVADYTFAFVQQGGSWQARILRQPSYGTRPSSPSATRRTRDPQGQYLVSSAASLGTIEAAQLAARNWAEGTQRYLTTGTFVGGSGAAATGGARQPGDVTYRTLDGTGLYVFRFVQSGRAWRAVIIRQPPYAGRPSDVHSSHRLGLHTAAPYVCWTPEPTSRAAVEEVARLWAEGTQHYIAHGGFPSPRQIPDAPPGHGPRPSAPPLAGGAPVTPSTPRRRTLLERLRERIG